MGRHADPDAGHFWRSLGAAVMRGGLGLAVVVVLFAVLAMVGRPGDDGPAMVGDPGDEAVAPARDDPAGDGAADPAQVGGADDDNDADEDPADTDDAEDAEDADDAEDAVDPAEVTVQVLDGVGDPARADEVADVVSEAGYEVVAVNAAARDYDVTTVLFSEDREQEARALAEVDDRFAEVRPNPNLSQDIDVHGVVGRNWSG
jgi:hypothetical protein